MHTFWSDVLYSMRLVSPFAMTCAILAVTCLVMYLVTKWREFAWIGFTAGIYMIPFIFYGANHYHH